MLLATLESTVINLICDNLIDTCLNESVLMPELPEVETTKRGITPFLNQQTVDHIVVRQAKLRWPIPENLNEQISGSAIVNIERRAKYLLIHFAHGVVLVHLGMSGSLRVFEADQLPEAGKHDHVDLVLKNGTTLRYHDPRRFGAWLWYSGALEHHPLLNQLGPEPLSDDFDAAYLQDALSKQKRAIKLALMDNHVVVGVGNIYANEALFRSGILPTRAANQVNATEINALVEHIKEVLTQAIAAGGSTLRDFVNSDGKSGYFQQQYFVYGREHQACLRCDGSIHKIVIGQRSSFYCPHCQH